MSNALDQLYYHFTESVSLDEEGIKKMKALATAKLAILEELNLRCDDDCRPLIEVLDSLDAQTAELHSRALFFAAFEAGMELGRLQIS